ncbi:MAG: hypothetical protein ACRDF0_10080, partial [Candidatus Limnocylindria bacterium]
RLAPPPAPLVAAPPAALLHSAWQSQSLPPVISLGGTTTVSMLFRNTGDTPWIKGTAAEARLGVVGDDPRWSEAGMAVNWPAPTRAAAQSEAVVAPGQIATFRFAVKGTLPGVHTLRLRPVVDGVAWLDDQGAHVVVTVRQ